VKSQGTGEIVVYGANWCPDCRRAKEFLGSHRIEYRWVDLEQNPDQVAEVERRNNGKRFIPTIVFPDGTFVTEPTNDELADRLGLSRAAVHAEYDLVVIGGGPTGLTTSIYAARENARVLIIDKSVPGGQAAVTERLDNYPGFPDGVAGADLADRITRQAKGYGVEILQAVSVTGIEQEKGRVFVHTSTGDRISAKPVLVATGSTYRRSGAAGEADLIGADIHFCATCDGPFYKGAKELIVIGGGNSGLEEGLFLAQFAEHVTVIQRGASLSASLLLRDKVNAHPKMTVLTNTEVVSFQADSAGKFVSLELRDRESGVARSHAASAAFVYIGLAPQNFIMTDRNFRTKILGVFAAGDVREGSTKQLASAVGEGAAAAIQIRYHLESLASDGRT
jgi:thioredoxin reductase (NADPH)